ncbi:MAG: flagellar basal body-associated FliL family protein [Pirellulales bacterium]
MADQTVNVEEVFSSEAPHTGGSPWFGRIKVVGFLLVVIAVECALAAMFIPSATETEAMAQAMLAPEAEGDRLPVEPLALAAEPELEKIEVDLGEFHVASFQPLSNTTLQIDFHLYGTILLEEEHIFKELLEEKEQRVRDQILTSIRSAEVTDLTDAGLGLIKRKILETTNRTLGRSVLQEVIFSNFSFVEQ